MRLLLVEDEMEMASALMEALVQRGNIVDHVATIELAREALLWKVHEAVLLDRQLPDGEGLHLLAEIRERGIHIPVIILTAHNEPSDRVQGLDEGADDYIGKPFLADELMARLRAASRRSSTYASNLLSVGNVSIVLTSMQVEIDGNPLQLPRREVLVLKALLKRSGKAVLRRSLEEALYGYEDEIQSNALDSHVSKLRKKLVDAKASVTIESIRGLGYILKAV